VALAHAQLLAAGIHRMARQHAPPDVVAARVHELELEVVARPLAMHPQEHREIGRERERQRPAQERVARDAAKVVVEAKAAPVAAHRGAHVVGRRHLPQAGVAKIVEDARVRRRGRQRQDRGQEEPCGARHCFTPPARRPCM
jgi:hypothetical protein